MKSVAILMPWFGPWPEWIALFLESCRHNDTIDWFLFSDQPKPRTVPPNVRFIPMSRWEFSKLTSRRLRIPFVLFHPYKLCDLRPAFGLIFEDYVAGYDYFGFGDLDVIYGNIRRFVDDAVLSYPVISFHAHRLSGHFCLFANTRENRNLHLKIRRCKLRFLYPGWLGLDDKIKPDRSKSLFFESYNTPHVRGMPWKDGSFDYPSEWYWKDGVLTNNKDEGDFLYFHFMVWKGGRWGRSSGGGQFERLTKTVHVKDEDVAVGWRINETGFWGLR